jgi:hypothetical protein
LKDGFGFRCGNAWMAAAACPKHASHPVQSRELRERLPRRFPDPANLLPNPVWIADFVHASGTSAVRLNWEA